MLQIILLLIVSIELFSLPSGHAAGGFCSIFVATPSLIYMQIFAMANKRAASEAIVSHWCMVHADDNQNCMKMLVHIPIIHLCMTHTMRHNFQ